MSLVSDVQELLDETGVGTFWPKAHIYDACNQAQLDVWAKSHHDTVTSTLTLSNNSDLVAIPTGVYIPLYLTRSNTVYWPTTQARLEQHDREWKKVGKAAPKWFVMWDQETFRVFPKSDATYNFVLWGVRYPPTEVSGSAEDITAPSLIKQAVASTAAGLLTMETRPDLSEGFLDQAKDLLQQFMVQRRNLGGHRIWRLRPGMREDVAAAGNIDVGATYSNSVS